MKKILSLVVSLVLTMGVLAGCGEKSETPSGDGDKLKVALVYSGFLGDKSFNDSAHEGAMRAVEEFGIELKEMESKEPTEWESNFVAMAADGYDLVIAVSTQFEEIVTKHAPEFPETKFALIDGVVKGDNVVSSTFAQNEGSFLAGAAAALFTTKTDIEGVNQRKSSDGLAEWISQFFQISLLVMSKEQSTLTQKCRFFSLLQDLSMIR